MKTKIINYLNIIFTLKFIIIVTATVDNNNSGSDSDGLTNHLSNCCNYGKKYALENNQCRLNRNEESEALISLNQLLLSSSIWHDICISTYDMCCSREQQNLECIAGREAAKSGINCDDLNRNDNKSLSRTFLDCCKSCKIGLAVSANKQNCIQPSILLSLSENESYKICCNDYLNENNKQTSSDNNNSGINVSNRTNRNKGKLLGSEQHSTTLNSGNDANSETTHKTTNDDEEIFILNDNDDICKKIPNLCSQICENTRDSYKCRCHDGYKLDENLVTCSKIIATGNYDEEDDSDDDIEDDGAFDLDTDEDLIDSGTVEVDNQSCQRGFRRDPVTNQCEDIDECAETAATDPSSGVRTKKTNKCLENQYCMNSIGSYECLNIKPNLCDVGYRFNTKTNQCEDIDECEEIKKICRYDHYCINLPGKYECHRNLNQLTNISDNANRNTQILGSKKCNAGYQFKNNQCIDIDECKADKNACDSNQICKNEEGGYHCDCKTGFKMELTINACIDINECQINVHECTASQRCDNTIGSYTCIRLQSCGTGYTFNAETGNCDDDDECELNIHDCPIGYDCRNTKGSFRCDRKRYRPTTTTTTTTKRPRFETLTTSTSTTTTTTTTTQRPSPSRSNPWSSTIRVNNSTPIQTSTLATTSTSQGAPYYFDKYNRPIYRPQGRYNNSGTQQSQHRFRIPESGGADQYDTSCGRGFRRNHMNACVDVDECQIPGVCGSHEKCINSNGSYRCFQLLKCSGGFKSNPNGNSCVDIDECSTGEHNCAADQICHNRIGGYVCSCQPGHTTSSTAAQIPNDRRNRNERVCVDINECDLHVCPINSNCINTIGSYYCECKSGFKKQHDYEKQCVDIDECKEIPYICEQKCHNYWGSYRCACNQGYELNHYNNRSCDDIDECELHNKSTYKLCMGICQNTPGSYECSCPPGYELGTDKNSCRDIDECTTLNLCQNHNEICTNVRGSYRCTRIDCPMGYINDPDQKNRCRIVNKFCDEGEDCYQKPTAITYNFITIVSNLIIPPHGRILFTLRGPQWYENIEFDLKLIKTEAPANVEKATIYSFSTLKMRNEIQLSLMRMLEGPQDIELELSMTVFMNGQPRGKSIAKILVIVSEHPF